jgi:hypothetical protein
LPKLILCLAHSFQVGMGVDWIEWVMGWNGVLCAVGWTVTWLVAGCFSRQTGWLAGAGEERGP